MKRTGLASAIVFLSFTQLLFPGGWGCGGGGGGGGGGGTTLSGTLNG